jgi:hypothetical protein
MGAQDPALVCPASHTPAPVYPTWKVIAKKNSVDEEKRVRWEQCREAAASDLRRGSRTGLRDGCRLAQLPHGRCLWAT